jgi:hypothetical protein
MRKLTVDPQLKLFPELNKRETSYSRALFARARILQGYWLERAQGRVRTPDLEFFIELCRRHSQHDVRCAIEMTTGSVLASKLAWEQAEVDCRKYVAGVVSHRAQQKIADTDRKRPAASVSSAQNRRAASWIQ